jgi:hypothetical protein
MSDGRWAASQNGKGQANNQQKKRKGDSYCNKLALLFTSPVV